MRSLKAVLIIMNNSIAVVRELRASSPIRTATQASCAGTRIALWSHIPTFFVLMYSAQTGVVLYSLRESSKTICEAVCSFFLLSSLPKFKIYDQLSPSHGDLIFHKPDGPAGERCKHSR